MAIATLEEYERAEPRYRIEVFGRTVRFSTPDRLTKWRVDSLLTKEPCTIEWLRSFSPADVMIDVGANVGMYSILAGACQGCRVYAFEPESQNYALLNRNIHLNDLSHRVTAYPVALSDEAGLSLLHLGAFGWARSSHSLGNSVDHMLELREPEYAQGCIAATLDELVSRGFIPPPTRLKIDVDGFEHKVIAGGRETLRRPELHSILIEINHNLQQHRDLVVAIGGLGFRFDQAQVARAERPSGEFKGCAEYVFFR